MSRKRKTYSADFKAKLVLELLEGDKTLNEVASKYEVLPKSLLDWKKQFLANASLAFDKSAVVKEYKDQISELQKQKDATSTFAPNSNKKIAKKNHLCECLKQ